MKSKWIIGLIIMCLLAIAATAQETSGAEVQSGAAVSLPQQQYGNAGGVPAPRVPAQMQDSDSYPEQLQTVLNAMSAELAEIGQALREGKISRSEAEYLSMERYYVAMTRFQFLRTKYQDPNEANGGGSYAPPSAGPTVSADNLTVLTPTCSPDLPQQFIGYLQLSPVQLKSIEVEVTLQCRQIEPLIDQLEKSRRKELAMRVGGKLRAQEAQAFATEQSEIIKQLLLANSQLEARLYNILTAEQQQKVDGLLRQNLEKGTNLDLREQ